MKKFITAFLLLAIAIIPMAARDRVTTNVKELPATAQATLNRYFAKQKVNHIKIDHKTFGGSEYDVVLDNGTEIDFDSNGNWKEIDFGMNKVPDGILLKPIADYIKANFKGSKVTSIEVSRNKYELELSNGLDVEFDRDGTFRRIDR
ncbi:MAG: PepSY-like domain-containing protein [Firmicutes bacterium]|nr:PepSY-like domain-containing protein [Bacillota bacterium]MCM1401592.1 PepSY-like domain-containing protein [Bacteroides sp.]MCM1477246.1 PepSY-like domain-containing protein [Bacteroides sp.]